MDVVPSAMKFSKERFKNSHFTFQDRKPLEEASTHLCLFLSNRNLK